MAFKYQRRDPSAIDKRANQKSNDFEGFILPDFPVWAPKKGDNWIRILPPTWEDPTHYGMDVWVHYRVGADDATVLCLHKMEHPKTGKTSACRVCEAAREADRRGDEDLAKELAPRKRVAVWMVDMKEEDKGPQIWPMSWTVDRDIAKVSKDRRSGEVYTIDHPDDGYDIYFDREGEGIKTKYTGVQLAKRPSSVPDKWLDFIEDHPLPETLEWRTSEEVEALFGDDDSPRKRRRDDDDDRRPSRRRDDDERPSRRRDDDDKDERPSRARRRDDDDDDERPARRRDEDERPARRRDDDERPARRRDDDDKEERPSRARRRDEEEEEKPRRRRDEEPPFDAKEDSQRKDADDPPRKRRVPIEPDKEAAAEEKPRRRRDEDADDEEEKPRRRSADDDDRRVSGTARAEALRAKFAKRD